ncbi:hypothetical protein TVAG_258180 [Trichomonas vaginalis G3]|uniref:Cilia- and flagella-associated protein 58 central coiled coil domain-containing protein n=1 Tax=Trichomonas vaginalis (strain ATCC PRA-98 / G3) TaxID=412133 RepID=A2E922_TRIV3|nr:cilia- and flagella-associated protein 58-related family [Trichomonas vaginalis G3]EAY10816.1 hypothetical protein TVAG_258180 [Trichomonas vaginalis G3]KAI5519904.1 cilia- and flagella-associated protein 58-related family [Trichomonas vaginalis G3]|eukprot:XP_001323039.1 hypothetical protein [Trichomonas vaginalis G3]
MTEKGVTNSSVSDAQQQLAEFSQTTFTDLQHDFHELNHEIAKDSVLEPFRHEYAKLFGILQKSMTNQARYIEKGRVIESEIVGNKAKVRTVSKLAEEDSRSISNLNEDRDKKQAALTDLLASLHEAMEANEVVTSEITGLENELERCVLEERGQKDELSQLKARRVELTKQFEELNQQIPQLKENNRITQEKKAAKDKEIQDSIAELKRIDETVEDKQREDQMERQHLFELERDRENTRNRLKEMKQQVADKTIEVAQEQETVKQIDKKVREQKRRFESAKSEKQEISEKCQKYQKELDLLNSQIVAIEADIANNHNALIERQKVADSVSNQAQQQNNNRDKIRLKVQGLQERYEGIRKDTDAVRTQVDATEDRIATLRREGELTRKQIDTCVRDENSKLKKNEGELQHQTQAQTILQMYKNQAHNIDCEISIIKQHLQETQKKIYSIETEREHYSEELSAATSQFLHGQETLKDLASKVQSKTAEIVNGDRHVAQQQSLYEKVRSEREISSKKVKEVEAEITELENNFGRMKFAIEQHKDDIHRKAMEKLRDIESLKRTEDEDSQLREKLTQVEIVITTLNSTIVANDAEISKINLSIKHAEDSLQKHLHRLENVKKDSDAISNKTVEKEKEMDQVQTILENLKKQVKRGERDYDLKEMEIANLNKLINEKSAKLEEVAQIDDQLRERREQIHIKQKELMQLRAERAAMEEELAIPINIHNWTLLESSDPQRFERLKRYQELQADLVARTKQVADLQDKIKEKESQYNMLSAQVRHKPGIELEQKVTEYSEKVKSKKFNLEEVSRKLELYRDEVNEFRKDLTDVRMELMNERKKWIKQKKAELKEQHDLKVLQQQLEEQKFDDAHVALESVNKMLTPYGIHMDETGGEVTLNDAKL